MVDPRQILGVGPHATEQDTAEGTRPTIPKTPAGVGNMNMVYDGVWYF